MAKRTPNSATTPYMAEWALKNYLNKHGIYQDQWDLQTIIINSFVLLRGGSNDLPWPEKVIFTQNHFGLFAQYAQNTWRETNQVVKQIQERDCDLPKRDTPVKQFLSFGDKTFECKPDTSDTFKTKPIGVITRDRRVFLNFIRFDLGATSPEGYVQIEHIDHTRGRQFSKVYVFNHHWFPDTTEIIHSLERRGAEIIYI